MLLFAAASLAVIVFLPAFAVATEHIVGDESGWVLNFDYAKWAETKQFVVGDTIVFKYGSASHNVMEVGGSDFLACNKAVTTNALKTGEDRITLDKAGRRWFFCAVGEHCKNGMKLKITVLETAAPAPALPPSSPASNVQANFGQAAAAVTALAVAVLFL
uniref:Uncharacterized protein n=1 Tax=Avena sativa TaxID=4498 RepID=A0ACD6A6R4_AVESA